MRAVNAIIRLPADRRLPSNWRQRLETRRNAKCRNQLKVALGFITMRIRSGIARRLSKPKPPTSIQLVGRNCPQMIATLTGISIISWAQAVLRGVWKSVSAMPQSPEWYPPIHTP